MATRCLLLHGLDYGIFCGSVCSSTLESEVIGPSSCSSHGGGVLPTTTTSENLVFKLNSSSTEGATTLAKQLGIPRKSTIFTSYAKIARFE